MSKRYYVNESQFPALIAAAYSLSRPQGLGFLNASPGDIDQLSVDQIMKEHVETKRGIYMDYVRGRAVKLGTHREGDRFYISADRWYDHSIEQLEELAKRVGLVAEDVSESA